MDEKVLKYLYDIKIAIGEIDSYFEVEPRSYENYIQNSLLIIGLRNQIIHGYDSVSDENIWGIINIHLPNLKAEIESLIK